MTMIGWLKDQNACKDAIDLLLASGAQTPAEAVAACLRGEWLLWLADAFDYSADQLSAAVRPARLRSVQEHAPAALDAARLHGHAARLRALPDDVSAIDAAEAALAATRAMWPARPTTWFAAWAAWAAWTGPPEVLIEVPQWVAETAKIAGGQAAWEAERARCADEIRAALPDLAARWSAAMEMAP